jgi:hypothetical protein
MRAMPTAIIALLLSREQAAPLAYIGGRLGTLIGADLLNLGSVLGLGAPVASIGGAGTFDGIFLIGIVTVLIASLSQLWSRRSHRTRGHTASSHRAVCELRQIGKSRPLHDRSSTDFVEKLRPLGQRLAPAASVSTAELRPLRLMWRRSAPEGG